MDIMKTKFRPILFSAPMVLAILEGRKTQTRRKIRLPNYHPSLPEKQLNKLVIKDWILYDGNNENIGNLKCPYNVGDVLWVRETFTEWPKGSFQFFASTAFGEELGKWKPSIFMPKEACRIFLKIKSIRVERLQDISEEDSKAEGAKDRLKHDDLKKLEELRGWNIPRPFENYQFGFLSLWCSINGCDNWLQNPFVWVYEFEQIEKPLDFI